MCSLEGDMNLAGLYWVTSTARLKLSTEAKRKEHALRRLVGHANLLDNLMDEMNEVNLRDDATAIAAFPLSDEDDEEVQETDEDPGSDEDFSTESDESEDLYEEGEQALSLMRCPPSLPGTRGSVRCSEAEVHICNCSEPHNARHRGRHPHAIEYTVEEVTDEDEEDEVALEEEMGLKDAYNAASHSYGRNLSENAISTLLQLADPDITHRNVNGSLLESKDDVDALQDCV